MTISIPGSSFFTNDKNPTMRGEPASSKTVSGGAPEESITGIIFIGSNKFQKNLHCTSFLHLHNMSDRDFCKSRSDNEERGTVFAGRFIIILGITCFQREINSGKSVNNYWLLKERNRGNEDTNGRKITSYTD